MAFASIIIIALLSNSPVGDRLLFWALPILIGGLADVRSFTRENSLNPPVIDHCRLYR
jgi:hypothetical protein